MKVGIVILNWNGAALTLDCLQSVRRAVLHMGTDFTSKIVIVDNGSAPPLRQQAPQLASAHDVTIIENEQNLGFAAGMNSGLSFIRDKDCDAVWLLNNDLTVAQTSLLALCKFKERHPHKLCIGSVVIDQKTGHVQTLGGYRYCTFLGVAKPIGRCSDPLDWHHENIHLDYVDGSALFIDAPKLMEIGGIPSENFLYYEELNLAEALGGSSALAVCLDSSITHRKGATTEKLPNFSASYFSTLAALRYSQEHARWALPVIFSLRLAAASYRDLLMLSVGHTGKVLAALKDFLNDR